MMVSVATLQAQDSLLNWKTSINKINDSVFEITTSTTIAKGWHVYGNNPAVDGLTTVSFLFDYENAIPKYGPVFSDAATTINDGIFSQKTNVFVGSITLKQQVLITGKLPPVLKATIVTNIANATELIPHEYETVFTLNNNANTQSLVIPGIVADKVDTGNLWLIFLLGIGGGLIALLTPCVFPMIPVTVSFFTKRSPNRKTAVRNGVMYGLFILLIYAAASLPFHLLNNVNPEIFNNISTSPTLNVIFFAIFIVFAISFFGFFEITLPSSIATKADTKSSLGSLGGIFFMALTLAIVSFSCTGPILGSLLVGTSGGGAWALTAGMSGFGLALALPFAVFAIFPNLLAALPKSGGWLDTVKKVLAFLEVALALKFLSNADLAMHWGILKREVFIGIWILISLGLSLYLFGILRLPHDYKGQKIPAGRKVLGVIALLFTIYLLPGVTQTKYANLKLLSGFAPPLSYSIYGKDNIHGKGLEANVTNDYNKAIAMARAQGKPLLIDFTGWNCVNCRKMEEQVWTKPAVYSYIKENFILLSLYVDDKEKLPVEERIYGYKTKDGNVKDIITVGDKWATFQSENFNHVTQPYYAIITNAETLANKPEAYLPDANKYLQWLTSGKTIADKTGK